jgi:hypothetical protein
MADDDKKLEDELDKVAVWEPIDIGDDPVKTVSLDDIPPGPEREQAEQLLADLRARRERETR